MIARIIFSAFMEDDAEKIYFVFRTPFIFMLFKAFVRTIIFGTITVAIWWYDHYWEYWYLVEFGFLSILLYMIFSVFMHWYVNAIVMTNEGLIFITWPRFFHRSFERIDFHNLDEIEVIRHGIMAFLFSYGSLNFQKVNGGEQIMRHKMARPQRATRRIEHYRETSLDDKNFTEEGALKDLLGQLVQKHVSDKGAPERFEDSHYKKRHKNIYGDSTKKKTSFWPFSRNNSHHQHSGEDAGTLFQDLLVPETEESIEIIDKLNRSGGIGNQEESAQQVYNGPQVRKKIKRSSQVESNKVPQAEEEILIQKRLDDTGGVEMDLD